MKFILILHLMAVTTRFQNIIPEGTLFLEVLVNGAVQVVGDWVL